MYLVKEKRVRQDIIHSLLHRFICVRVDDILYIIHMNDRICRNKDFVP